LGGTCGACGRCEKLGGTYGACGRCEKLGGTYGACGRCEKFINNLVEKYVGKRPEERSKSRYEDNIKIVLKNIKGYEMDLFG